MAASALQVRLGLAHVLAQELPRREQHEIDADLGRDGLADGGFTGARRQRD